MAIEETAKYPSIIAPVAGPALAPEQFAKGKSTVTMVFEKDVLFTPVHGTRVRYTKGVHEVPREYADHWYLRNSEARIYQKPVALGAPASDDASAPKKGKKKTAEN